MSRLKLALVAAMLLSGFVLWPQSADAAKFCAQLRGSTAGGHPDCSFSTLDKCRARVRHLGGGHCYKLRAWGGNFQLGHSVAGFRSWGEPLAAYARAGACLIA